MVVYIVAGGFQALAAGTVSGLLYVLKAELHSLKYLLTKQRKINRLAVTYKAGLFAMSTWIPLCSSVVLILFHISTTYSMAGAII